MIDSTRVPTSIPAEVAGALLRALTWCGDQITTAQRELAWGWVEDHSEQREDMGE